MKDGRAGDLVGEGDDFGVAAVEAAEGETHVEAQAMSCWSRVQPVRCGMSG